MQDFEEDAEWCDKMHAYCSTSFTAKDLLALTKLKQEHIAFEDEMLRRQKKFLSGPVTTGQDMIKSGHPEADQFQGRVGMAQRKWLMLKEDAAKRRGSLESAIDEYLFISDSNEKKMVIQELQTLENSKVNLVYFTLFE